MFGAHSFWGPYNTNFTIKPQEYYKMYVFFLKKLKYLLKLWYIAFFSFENKPWGQNKVMLGVKIECCLARVEIDCTKGQNWVHPQKHWLCVDALNFDPRQHSMWNPSSTWFWPPGLIFKTKKRYKSQFQKYFFFLKKKPYIL